MAVPQFQYFIVPFLKVLKDGKVRKMSEINDLIKDVYPLSDEDYLETVSSGGNRYVDRVGWARTYLKKSGLIVSPKYGYHQITEAGLKELEVGKDYIDVDYLCKKYPGAYEFEYGSRKEPKKEPQKEQISEMTPTDLIDSAISSINSNLSDELLNEIYNEHDWKYFEKLVLKIMGCLGYGVDSASLTWTGKPGDGGIDGEINEDKLGFNKICIQAKHYGPNSPVNDETVRNFFGSMDVIGVTKGVMITTSTFTDKAKKLVDKNTNKKVILIDGQRLVKLMIDYNIGVQIVKSYEIKKVDSDFFEDVE